MFDPGQVSWTPATTGNEGSDATTPTPPPRRSRTSVIVGVVIAVLVVVAGTAWALRSPGEDPAASPTRTASAPPVAATHAEPTPTPAESSDATPSPTPAKTLFAGDLGTVLVPMPAGAERVRLTAINDEMPDITESATIWNPKDVAGITNLLKSSGYKRCATRVWSDQAGNTVVVHVMQFDHVSGHLKWLSWANDGIYAGAVANRGKITEFDDGPWAEYVSGERRELVLVFGKGEFGVVMRVNSPGAANLNLMKSVAIQQFQLLP